MMLKVAHCSMQFSDLPRHQDHDVNRLFARDYQWITGTEAGPDNDALHEALVENGKKFGYLTHRPKGQDCWVAAKQSLIRGDGFTDKGLVPVIKASEGSGRHGNRGIAWAEFDAVHRLGHITLGSGHPLTQGRKPGDPNFGLNLRYADAIGAWGRDKGAGRALVFYSGDQNKSDRTGDTFHGEPFTSAWDELHKYEDTGHGNIDVLASYNKDSRVRWQSVNALNDREVFLHTDHYLVEARVEIRPLS